MTHSITLAQACTHVQAQARPPQVFGAAYTANQPTTTKGRPKPTARQLPAAQPGPTTHGTAQPADPPGLAHHGPGAGCVWGMKQVSNSRHQLTPKAERSLSQSDLARSSIQQRRQTAARDMQAGTSNYIRHAQKTARQPTVKPTPSILQQQRVAEKNTPSQPHVRKHQDHTGPPRPLPTPTEGMWAGPAGAADPSRHNTQRYTQSHCIRGPNKRHAQHELFPHPSSFPLSSGSQPPSMHKSYSKQATRISVVSTHTHTHTYNTHHV
jgi:hypothetical protein